MFTREFAQEQRETLGVCCMCPHLESTVSTIEELANYAALTLFSADDPEKTEEDVDRLILWAFDQWGLTFPSFEIWWNEMDLAAERLHTFILEQQKKA